MEMWHLVPQYNFLLHRLAGNRGGRGGGGCWPGLPTSGLCSVFGQWVSLGQLHLDLIVCAACIGGGRSGGPFRALVDLWSGGMIWAGCLLGTHLGKSSTVLVGGGQAARLGMVGKLQGWSSAWHVFGSVACLALCRRGGAWWGLSGCQESLTSLVSGPFSANTEEEL